MADFDQDGRKEVIFATAQFYVEALVGESGERAHGWPLTLAGSDFLSSPLVYDIDNSGKLDVVVATEEGVIVFVDQSGVPLFNYTMKISPAPMPASWFEGLESGLGETYWEMMRRRDVLSMPNRYRNRGKVSAVYAAVSFDRIDGARWRRHADRTSIVLLFPVAGASQREIQLGRTQERKHV